jgi:hypothetical protein
VLTTLKCAVVRLRALVARHSARLISNRSIVLAPQKRLEKVRKEIHQTQAKF